MSSTGLPFGISPDLNNGGCIWPRCDTLQVCASVCQRGMYEPLVYLRDTHCTGRASNSILGRERERAGDTRGSIHVLRNWSVVCFSLKCVMVYDRCDFNITLDIPPFIQCFTTRGNNTVAIFRYWIAQRPLLGDWTWYSAPNCWQIARIWWHCTWYNELFELQRKSFIYCSKQSILYQCIVSVCVYFADINLKIKV